MRLGRKTGESTTARVEVQATFTLPFEAPGLRTPGEVEQAVAAQVHALLAKADDLGLVFHIPEYTPPSDQE